MRKVEVSHQLTVKIDGVPYSWDKETALQIAEGIAKSFGLRLEKDLPTVWPTPYVYPQTGLPGGVAIPAKVTYGTDSTGSIGGQADQVCAAENKKFKERTVRTPAYKDPQSYVNTDVAS